MSNDIANNTTMNIINNAINKVSFDNEYSIAVTKKAKDIIDQEGQNVIKLIKSSTSIIDVRV